MSSPLKVVLYDIPTKEPKHCWSWNVWKTRFILNFKGIDYTTEWTEYPDIKPKLEKYFPNKTDFTVPTVQIAGSDEHVMDSVNIAARLEADHPTPSVHLDSPYHEPFVVHARNTLVPLQAIFIPLVPVRLLSGASVPFFVTTREKDIGSSLEQFGRERGGEPAWEAASKALVQITTMLQENEGPFFMGHTVSYTDFFYAGILLFFKSLGDDIFNRLLKASGDDGKTMIALLEAVEPWSKRDSS